MHKLITLLTITFLLFVSTNAQDVRGIWYWTWSSSASSGGNLGIAFSGWTDPAQALSSSNNVVGNLQGDKYISLGGGNDNGRWTASAVQSVASYCSQGQFNGYTGVAFDIEEGDSGLSDAFISCFQQCKNRGYKVLVTISHSTPYGIPDGSTLMNAFFNSASLIDYMSPQLYTSGSEGSNDFTANGVGWGSYKPFSGKLIPSIVSSNLYASAQSYFAGLGITTVGFVQWSQTAPISGGSPSSSGSSSGSTVRCGANWGAANSGCGSSCSVDSDCPSGQSCFKDLNPCSAPSNPPPSNPPPSNPPPATGSTVRCGANWGAANSGCGSSCSVNSDCPSGQSCFKDLSPCSAPSNPPPSNPPSSASSTRCGASWADANSKCSNSCTDDSQCNGQQCWASLSMSPCGSNAVAENSNVFTETTPVTGKELSPLAVGLIVGGCVMFVVVVAVIVVVVITSRKTEEKV